MKNPQELILEVAQAIVDLAVEQGPESLGHLELLTDGEVNLNPDELKHPSQLSEKLAQTQAFQRVDLKRAQQWSQQKTKDKDWQEQAESLLPSTSL